MERLPGESGEVGGCRSEARGGLREYTKWRAAGHEGAQCHLDSLTKVDFVPENGGVQIFKQIATVRGPHPSNSSSTEQR